MNILIAFLVCTAIALLAAIIGKSIQSRIHFLYPVDPVTVLLFIFSAGIICIYAVNLWYVLIPLWAGYFTGYYINGYTSYILVEFIYLAQKEDYRKYWVVYVHNGNTCIQDQSWGALFKRFFYNIHHIIDSNVPFEADWYSTTVVPLLPQIKKPLIKIEAAADTVKKVKKGPIWLNEITTHIVLAYGSRASKTELAVKERLLADLNERVEQAEHIATIAEYEKRTIVPQYAAELLAGIYNMAPANRIRDTVLDKWTKMHEDEREKEDKRAREA